MLHPSVYTAHVCPVYTIASGKCFAAVHITLSNFLTEESMRLDPRRRRWRGSEGRYDDGEDEREEPRECPRGGELTSVFDDIVADGGDQEQASGRWMNYR